MALGQDLFQEPLCPSMAVGMESVSAPEPWGACREQAQTQAHWGFLELLLCQMRGAVTQISSGCISTRTINFARKLLISLTKVVTYREWPKSYCTGMSVAFSGICLDMWVSRWKEWELWGSSHFAWLKEYNCFAKLCSSVTTTMSSVVHILSEPIFMD